MVKQKKLKFFEQKKCKNSKKSHAFKGYASCYDIRTLNSFEPELQLKDTKFAIKK